LRLLMLRGRLECSLEIVEYRQQLLHQPLVGARGLTLLVARHPLAVVLELGCDPLEIGQVLVPFALDLREQLIQFGGRGGRLPYLFGFFSQGPVLTGPCLPTRLRHYERLASSSMTS